MRRLPIFFVIDVSESMVGEPLRRLEEGIERIVSSLRQDPQSLETVYISLIAFAGKAKALTPLVDLVSFYPPKIPVGGGTALGEALQVLMKEIDDKVVKTTMETRGDWEPVVFLITDGKPTDQPMEAVKKWQQDYASKASLVAITLGTNADIQILSKLTDNVMAIEEASDEQFMKFIEWVSASVRAQSQKVEMGAATAGVSLEKADDAGLTIVKDADNFAVADPDYVVLTARCSKNKKPYLMKYARSKTDGISFVKSEFFGFEGSYALDDSYFDWSSEAELSQSVSTASLEGGAPCPQCSNPISFAMCECKRLLCLDQSGLAKCPWCAKSLQFDMRAGGGDFDVERGQG